MKRVGLALALSCVALAMPAHAGPLDPQPALVITGSGPTVATFTLRSEVKVDYQNATATFSGAYTGVLIETVRGKFQGGVVWVAALAPGPLPTAVVPQHPKTLGRDTYVLPPGSYRAYLLADKDAEVTLPLRSGDTPLAVKATRAVRQVFATDRTDFAVGQTSVTLRKSVSVGKHAYLVMMGQHSGWLTKGLDLRLCLAKRAKPCNPAYDPDMPMQGDAPYGVQSISFTRDDVKAGSRDVLLTATIGSTVKASVAYGYVEVDRL